MLGLPLGELGLDPLWTLTIIWLIGTGLVGFFTMGIDKSRARNHSRRIPEIFFFELAFLGGVFGILLGSSVLRHKSRKVSFLGVIFLAAIIWVAILIGLERMLGSPLG